MDIKNRDGVCDLGYAKGRRAKENWTENVMAIISGVINGPRSDRADNFRSGWKMGGSVYSRAWQWKSQSGMCARRNFNWVNFKLSPRRRDRLSCRREEIFRGKGVGIAFPPLRENIFREVKSNGFFFSARIFGLPACTEFLKVGSQRIFTTRKLHLHRARKRFFNKPFASSGKCI